MHIPQDGNERELTINLITDASPEGNPIILFWQKMTELVLRPLTVRYVNFD